MGKAKVVVPGKPFQPNNLTFVAKLRRAFPIEECLKGYPLGMATALPVNIRRSLSYKLQ